MNITRDEPEMNTIVQLDNSAQTEIPKIGGMSIEVQSINHETILKPTDQNHFVVKDFH
jgi:hypothetical protein